MHMEYAYLWLNVFMGAVWLSFFYLRPYVRREMLTMSAAITPLGLLNPVFAVDYFRPEYVFPFPHAQFSGLEDLLWAFFIGGIAAVVYEEIFRRMFHRRGKRPHPLVMFSISVSAGALFIISALVLSLSSILVGCVLLTLMALIEIVLRPDLLRESIVAGVVTAAIMFLSYIAWLIPLYPDAILEFWVNTHLIFGVPYQEILFGFAWGLVAGPAYEFALGLAEVRRRPQRRSHA